MLHTERALLLYVPIADCREVWKNHHYYVVFEYSMELFTASEFKDDVANERTIMTPTLLYPYTKAVVVLQLGQTSSYAESYLTE